MLEGSLNKNAVGLNNSNNKNSVGFKSDDPYVTPEEKKDEEPEQPSNAHPRALHPYFPPESPNDGTVYNGPWNEDYLKKGNVMNNMKELETFPFVQVKGSENAAEAFQLTTDHWKLVNEEFPMAHLHGVVVALYHSHMNVLEQMSLLERNNEILQNNNTHLFETVQSLTTRLNDLENVKPAEQIPPKKRGKWQ
jgi:proteasome lid subunit RPN8/RPN11